MTKLIAALVAMGCAAVAAFAISTQFSDLPSGGHWLSNSASAFLFIFFGLTALTVPLIIALPQREKATPSPAHTKVKNIED